MSRPAAGSDTPPDGFSSSSLDMKSRALYFLLMQGLGVVAMAVWLYVMWMDNQATRKEARACQNEIIQIQETQNEKLIKALNDLTATMEDLKAEKNTRKR